MSTYRLQCNTDAIDIKDKCLGIDAWRVGDSLNLLNSNRGLHIQIRHNGDMDTLDAASEISRLIAAAPDLLKALKDALMFPGSWDKEKGRAAIAKAEGAQ